MKEATGEVSMTVIVLIAVAAIAAIMTWLLPKVKDYVANTWGDVSDIDQGSLPE